MNREETSGVTLTGVAIAVVALARYVGSTNPEMAPYLRQALASAERIGVESIDLALLKTIISALALS